jgi:site-specific DNA-methyltransferase (adenine-specific)
MLICADVLDWANEYEGAPFHAMLCDPPYHLTDDPRGITRYNGAMQEKYKGRGGFMGKQWDGGDIAFRPETWAALAQHLHPGAFIMAFASTRGFHRQAVAMEDAGLIAHPFIGWVTGSSFPKATRVKGAPAFKGHRYGRMTLKNAIEPILVFQKPYKGKARDNIVNTGAGTLNINAARVRASGDQLQGAGNGEGWCQCDHCE